MSLEKHSFELSFVFQLVHLGYDIEQDCEVRTTVEVAAQQVA